MKKTKKKLVLAKETVRNLDVPGLRRVAGATYITMCYQWNCTQPADSNSCATCTGGNTATDTCACNSDQFACPITAGDSCIGC